MKFAPVGVGAAGGRIVDWIRGLETNGDRRFSNGNVLVFDTDSEAFAEYDYVPSDRQVLIGDTYPDVEGRGTGGDIDLGAAVAREDKNEIYREFDSIEVNDVDALLLVAGFGGGTGGGTGAALLEELRATYEVPVYVLGVLPHDSEGDRPASNAARSLRSFVPAADNVILFDNDAWHSEGESLAESHEELNRELATRVVSLLAAGELEGADIAENRVDSTDMVRTLGTGGVSTIGYATTELDVSFGLLAWLRSLFTETDDSPPSDAAQIKSLVRRTVTTRLTLPCEVSSAERALVVLSGPPSGISRKGFERARYWLEAETDTVEVLAGDEPKRRTSTLTATVLLSNVTDVPRIEELQSRALASEHD